MKKQIFMLAVIACLTLTARAQEEGQYWIGGSLNFKSTEVKDDEKVNAFSFGPQFGYGLSDKWAIGVNLLYSHAKAEDLESSIKNDLKTNGFGFAPFARYTCLRWKAVSVFVDGGLYYENAKNEHRTGSNKYKVKANSFGAFLTPGFTLRLSNTIALRGELNFFDAGYSTIKDGDEKTTEFSADLNSPFNLDNFTVGFDFRF